MANNFGRYKENRITQHTIDYYFINKLDIKTKGLFGVSKNKNVNFIGFISNELDNLKSIMTNNICKKIVGNIISILNKNIYRILKKLSTQKQYDATDVDTLRRYARIVIDNLILLENAAGVEPERAD